MNGLQKLIIYASCVSIPSIISAQEIKQDLTKINLNYKTELEQHPFFSKFFDSYVKYDALDFYNNQTQITKINRLEKHLKKNLDFFIESKNNSIKTGITINFNLN